MYAIIQTGGKQYKVVEGDVIYIEKLDAEEETAFEFDHVLMIAKDDSIIVGNPTIDGAKVMGKVEKHGRGKKLVVYKYKRRKNYSRKQGHRQPFTKVTIEQIIA